MINTVKFCTRCGGIGKACNCQMNTILTDLNYMANITESARGISKPPLSEHKLEELVDELKSRGYKVILEKL